MGATACTTFLKISGEVVATLPARWNLPLLLNGSEVVPSYCSNRTELFPNKSKTKAVLVFVFSSTAINIFLIFSGHGVQPATVTPTMVMFGSEKWAMLYPRLLAPTSVTTFSRISD
jgi:hypothetical protein